ncbi:DUF11 domain-containing protein [Streptomyces sp. L2]|uniref:DUF11 domain-containing protein n=1 Tax=Streptomyces sp. L2 TaxID=2162665 RepID=UPI0013E92700|nr:DUF11 domain-containing protein [Streptomyces sp. L2]
MRRLLAATFLTVCAVGVGAPTASAAGSADLSIKIEGPQPGPPPAPAYGTSVTYQVTVTNDGPDTATGWSFYLPVIVRAYSGTPQETANGLGFAPRTMDSRCSYPVGAGSAGVPSDVLSAVTCAGGALAPGASTTFTISGDQLFEMSRTVTLVSGNETDPNNANNTASSTNVVPVPMIDPALGAGAAAASLAVVGVSSYRRRRGTGRA